MTWVAVMWRQPHLGTRLVAATRRADPCSPPPAPAHHHTHLSQAVRGALNATTTCTQFTVRSRLNKYGHTPPTNKKSSQICYYNSQQKHKSSLKGNIFTLSIRLINPLQIRHFSWKGGRNCVLLLNGSCLITKSTKLWPKSDRVKIDFPNSSK